ncbi:Transcriptional regulatory protein DegU [bacterium HR30]|nr:Transcriptional regulatory protein DegU [bacterium HR30]
MATLSLQITEQQFVLLRANDTHKNGSIPSMDMSQKALTRIRVLLADDHVLVRGRVRGLLESTQLFQVVAEVSDGPTAVAETQRLCPDLVILDFALPCLDGFKTAFAVRTGCPKARIVMLSMYDEPGYAQRALLSGAGAFLPKCSLDLTLVPTILRLFEEHEPFPSTPPPRPSFHSVESNPLGPLVPVLSGTPRRRASAALARFGKAWRNWRLLTRSPKS